MKIGNILDEFVDECAKKLRVRCIMQFGSSTYSKNPDDIDLAFFSKENFLPTADILLLLNIIKKFENKYNELVFDFSGVERKKKGKYNITVVFVNKFNVSKIVNIFDKFFYKNLIEDKNKRILFGNDVLNFDVELTNLEAVDILSREVLFCLRSSLDDQEYRLQASYRLFKTTLRLMLLEIGSPKKGDLLDLFKEKHGKNVILPKRAYKIINNDLTDRDFEEILRFTESCLKYLVDNNN